MDYLIKLQKTGKTIPTQEAMRSHEKGKLCLTCGIFVGTLCCESCKPLEKCKLCGIVCKVTPTNKVYSYVRTADRLVSEEVFQEVVTICQTLTKEGLCEFCVSWESRMKHMCFLCKNPFENSQKEFKEKGNCCKFCQNAIINKVNQQRYRTKNKVRLPESQDEVIVQE